MNWDEVFSAYPNAEKIYVVDGQPFLEEDERHARNHSKTTGKPVIVVEKPKKTEPATTETTEKTKSEKKKS